MARFVPATVTELSRVGLFQELPGEVLTKLAQNMRRTEIAPGDPIVLEGEEGDDFYVILRGLVAVSHPGGLGPQLIVDDGGDATLLIHKGYELENGSDWVNTKSSNKDRPGILHSSADSTASTCECG